VRFFGVLEFFSNGPRVCFALALVLASIGSRAATVEVVTFTNASGLALPARFYRPDGPGPFPALVVIHGSGGLWKNDNPAAGVMKLNFLEWSTNLTAAGWAALFVDSYTPRGLVEFKNRRPAQDPALDDAPCSPAYERPKDVLAALRYLRSRSEIRANRVGLISFSQGAESALAGIVHSSISKPSWTVSYLLTNGVTTNLAVSAPVRLQTGEAPFAVAICYYPGCGFFGYFGPSSGTNAGLYFPNAPVLMMHGSSDPLYSGNLYPEKFRLKARSQSGVLGYRFTALASRVYTNAAHSFDEAVLGGDPSLDDPDQSAKRQARILAMAWSNAYLNDLILTANGAGSTVQVRWPGHPGFSYLAQATGDFRQWRTVNVFSTETPGKIGFDEPEQMREFYRAAILAPGIELLP
jgi:dienelactone hydrolase